MINEALVSEKLKQRSSGKTILIYFRQYIKLYKLTELASKICTCNQERFCKHSIKYITAQTFVGCELQRV